MMAGATQEAELLVPPPPPASAPGLSAHAQALWLAAVRYRLLADQLARESAGGARR